MEKKLKNNNPLMGYCGIFCETDCEVYTAAHSGDLEIKKRIAKTMGNELSVRIQPEDLRCEGCQGSEEKMWFECRLCLIRQCAKVRKVTTCLECEHYPCQVLKLWFGKSEHAEKNLREISKIGIENFIYKKRKM